MHNLLTTLSLIALIGAGVLGFMNKNNATQAAASKVAAEDQVKKGTDDLAKREAETEDVKAQLETAETELANFTKESEALVGQISDKETELEEVESAKSDATAELDVLKEEIAKIGDLEAMTERLDSVKADNAKLEAELSSLVNSFESANTQADNLQTEIDGISERQEMQNKGQVPESFAATITQVYPEWGFVIIGAGNQQRAAENAQLSVRRGGVEIGQIKVTDLFQNRSVADVVRGSVADGVSIQPGDRVFAMSDAN